MNWPNFLVIGAAKAGTSSLAQYLMQHSEIYLNRGWKELRFFAYDGQPPAYQGPGDVQSNLYTTSNAAAYCAHFDNVTREKAIGEVSPVYLYSERAPARIQHYVPDVKLIAILRDPAERAYSHFLHMVRDGREPLWDFARALEAEDARVEAHWEWSWHYRRVGLYAQQLQRYWTRFDRRRIRVYLYEDFQTDPSGLFKDLFRFLEVDESFIPNTSVRHNVSGIPRRPRVAQTVLALRRAAKKALGPLRPLLPRSWWRQGAAALWRLHNRNLVKPDLDPRLRQRLVETYRTEIVQLQTLIERDLSAWLRC